MVAVTFLLVVVTAGIRSAPGLNSDTVFRGEEAEVFVVKDGPQNADGYIWWYLVARMTIHAPVGLPPIFWQSYLRLESIPRNTSNP